LMSQLSEKQMYINNHDEKMKSRGTTLKRERHRIVTKTNAAA
jgi:hypothetical protein